MAVTIGAGSGAAELTLALAEKTARATAEKAPGAEAVGNRRNGRTRDEDIGKTSRCPG